jgi:hypothetical protein
MSAAGRSKSNAPAWEYVFAEGVENITLCKLASALEAGEEALMPQTSPLLEKS